jgi:peptidoglycan/xylan/chitin deacetylase (PgdA/CDA1 family)
MYHSVGARRLNDNYGLSVPVKLFKEQMTHLENEGTSFIKMDQSLKQLESSQVKFVAITFDDGYKDNLNAADILIEKSIPFSIYCIADKMGQDDYLSFQDLRSLHETGLCTIGGHGLTHGRLGVMSNRDQIDEIHMCRNILEQGLCNDVVTMSLPHGSLNSKTLQFARDNGFELVCSSRPGLNTENNFDPFHIRRTEIRSQDTILTFVDKFRGSDDWREYVYFGKSLMSWAIDAQWARYR